MKLRGKHAAIAVALIGGGVLAASAFLFRNDLLEMWHLSRLESKDPDERRAALEDLLPIASGRSAPALLRVAKEDSPLRAEAIGVLLAASPRMDPARRREAALALRGMVEGREDLDVVYRSLAVECPGLYPLLSEDLRGEDETLRKLAARILIEAWPRSRQDIVSFARDAGPRDLLAFLGRGFGFVERDRSPRQLLQAALRRVQSGANSAPLEETPIEVIRGTLDVARTLLLDHDRPEARAAALGFLVCRRIDDPGALDLELLKEVYTRDTSFLVRRAALRIAGHIGDVPGNLDLPALIWTEPDPALRATAILARDVWSLSERNEGFELWEGAAATWVPRPHRDTSTPWTVEEGRALEQLLLEEKNHALRDAASMALAGRHRHFVGSKRGPPTRADLEVREWSLIRSARDVAGDASLRLPEFVRDAGASPWRQADDALFVSHGAVFFDADSPASLLVLLEPCEKLPLDVHPRSTSYFAAHPGLQDGRIDPDSGETILLVHRDWIPQQVQNAPLPAIDWCGLRVGYPETLEPRPEPVIPGSPWDTLRKASAKSVALRGSTERFLFYGGRLGVSSPVRTLRGDSTPRLLVAVRPLSRIPCSPEREPFVLTPIPALLVIDKPTDQPARGKLLENLDGDTPPRAVDLRDLDLDEKALLAELEGLLVRAGLSTEDAGLLIESSRGELVEMDGTRLAWLLPRWLHDALLGLTVLPSPAKLVRVGLVVEEIDPAFQGPSSAEDRALLWELEPIAREDVQAEFTQGPLPAWPSEPLALEKGELDGLALDISSDGTRTLIQRDSEHCIVDLEARRLIRVGPLQGQGNPWWPALSADGKHVSFSIWKENQYHMQVADLERETLHSVSLDDHAFPKASISGNGHRVGVSSGDGIRMLDLEARKAWFVRVGLCRDSVLELSGDGRRGVCLNPDGSDENVLLVDLETGAALDISRSAKRDVTPSISWDGNRVAFVRTHPGLLGVWVADLAARTRTRVSVPGSGGQFTSISADGSHIAFTAGGKAWVRELRSGGLREVGSSEGGVAAHVSNDGKRTVFTVRDAGGFHVRFEPAEE